MTFVGRHITMRRCFAKQSFILPDLGEKLKDATVLEYLVKVGQKVKQYDAIALVSTEKSTIEISSDHPGTILKFHVDVGQSCNVGSPLYDIDVVGDEVTDKPSKHEGVEEVTRKESKTEANTRPKHEGINSPVVRADLGQDIKHSHLEIEVLSTPAVRKLASSLDVNIAYVKGTGPNGRVLKEDVLLFNEIVQNAAAKLANQGNQAIHQDVPKLPSTNTPKTNILQSTPVQMTQFERGMVHTMTYAATIPHFNLHEVFDINDLFNMRLKLKEAGINISLFALIVKSFSLALAANPKMNSTYYPDKDQFTYMSNPFQNISIAIDGKFGLAAPNIKNVQNLSSEDIDSEIKHLRDLADTQRLRQEHLTGGTIALSNVGTISGYLSSPLNLPGQCCIVALGKVVTQPIWFEKTATFEPRKSLPVSFGCDHRVLDGATVARFSKSWRHYIEEPYLILSKLK